MFEIFAAAQIYFAALDFLKTFLHIYYHRCSQVFEREPAHTRYSAECFLRAADVCRNVLFSQTKTKHFGRPYRICDRPSYMKF